MNFFSFHNSLRSSIFSLLKYSVMNMLVPLGLFVFCRFFTLCLYLRRLHIIVRRLFLLFELFCLLGVINQVSPGTLVAVSLNNLPKFPVVYIDYHLPSGYFSSTYPLDLIASVWHSPASIFSIWWSISANLFLLFLSAILSQLKWACDTFIYI